MNMTGRVSRFDTENRMPVQSYISLKWKTMRRYPSCFLIRDMQICMIVCVCVLATCDFRAAMTSY